MEHNKDKTMEAETKTGILKCFVHVGARVHATKPLWWFPKLGVHSKAL